MPMKIKMNFSQPRITPPPSNSSFNNTMQQLANVKPIKLMGNMIARMQTGTKCGSCGRK
jgi:hypothetical protein